MAVPISDTSSLLRPLRNSDVVLFGEDVYYAQRQHWAAIVQPVYETFLFLLAVILIVDVRVSGFDDVNRWVVVILAGGAIHTVVLFISGGRAPTSRLAVDPFSASTDGRINPVMRWTIAIVLLLMVARFGPGPTGIIVVFFVISRLITIIARWSFYERRYITNRRLIESSGFLGSRISSMPLARVTDIVYSKSVSGEIFDYARMRVETAGQDQALGVVRFINNPDHFYEVLARFVFPETKRDDTEKLLKRTQRAENSEG